MASQRPGKAFHRSQSPEVRQPGIAPPTELGLMRDSLTSLSRQLTGLTSRIERLEQSLGLEDDADMQKPLAQRVARLEESQSPRVPAGPEPGLLSPAMPAGLQQFGSPSPLLPSKKAVSVLKEFCDKHYWAAPKYEIDTQMMQGFVCYGTLEAPQEVPFETFTPAVRASLIRVASAGSRTHRDAKEGAAQRILALLHAAGIAA